jgi:copper(I)-binding protein
MRLFVLLAALALAGCDGAKPEIAVSDVWARATVAGMPTAAIYLTITNKGAGDDRLVAVSVPSAVKASLHQMNMDGGVMRMRAVDGGIAIPAGQTVALAPSGTHIMVEGLSAPLVAGERIEALLRFERSGEMTVPVSVEAAGAR